MKRMVLEDAGATGTAVTGASRTATGGWGHLSTSRRGFLGGLGALVGAGALGMTGSELVACTPRGEEGATSSAEDGEWRNAICWHNCGGKCVLKALVKDGSIVRLKNGDEHEETGDNPQMRCCPRGLSQRMQIVGKERLKYPMRRTHFDPNGDPGREWRGRDTWERISWDDALDIVAGQIKSIKAKYGSKGIYVLDGGDMARTLSLYGGYVSKYGSRSRGAWKSSMKPILGVDQKQHALNDRLDLLNAKLIILWGSNPAQNSPNMPLLSLRRAKENGARIVVIDPMYTRTAAVLADDYFPIRPVTDAPLIYALSYYLIKKDQEAGGTVLDWDFLNRCVQGFDADHMPEGADTTENYRDYVLGTYDGQPKTPEWASKLCGLPVARIEELAQMLIDYYPTTCLFSWGAAHLEKGTYLCLAEMALGAMTGNIGVAGGAFAVSAQEASTNGGPMLVKLGKDGTETIPNPLKTKLCTNHHWQDILQGSYAFGGKDHPLDIHMMYHSHCATLNQTNNSLKGIEAHRKVDFVVTNHFTFTPEAQYSDIVLPVTTPWEKEGGDVRQDGSRELFLWSDKVIDPYFEAKDDAWIAAEVAKRLGVDDTKVTPFSNMQRVFNMVAGTTVVMDNGKDYENLASITEDDIKELGVEGQPQEGRVPIMQLKEDGFYRVERHVGDNLGYIFGKKLREDPDANPLKTESGKLEIYCPALKKAVDKAGWNTGYAYAKYDPATEGYEATFADFDAGIKGTYPFQVYANHDLRGTHSVFNQVTWLREAFGYDAFINPVDAQSYDLKEGDVAEIFNSRGTILRRMHLTERVMPGVIVIHEGAWININEDGTCIGGSPNVLTGDFASGPDIESWNACICDIRKSDYELEDDWKVDLGVEPHE